jgi:hypothetical protein
VELYLYSLNTPSWRGAQLKRRDKFAFASSFERIMNCVPEASLYTQSYFSCNWGRDSSVSTVTSIRDGPPGFDSRQR